MKLVKCKKKEREQMDKLEETEHFENVNEGRTIILKQILLLE
jgi:hypothetical protein